MRISTTLVALAALSAVLALIAAGVGLLAQGGAGPFAFTTLRGATVQIYGQGVYQYDTSLVAIGFRMADVVTLMLGVPLLVVAVVAYRRGSLRGGLLLTGALAYFTYTYGSMALGAAYNNLFLLYVVLFSASLFALIIALTSFDLAALRSSFADTFPRRALGMYLIVSGVVLALVWLVLSIIPALLAGQVPPEVASYTTFMTGVLDLGVVAPALVVAGALLLRRDPPGYLLATTMLVFTAILGPTLTLAGIAQLQAGVVTVGQFVGFTAGFSVLTLLAIGFTVVLFRNVARGAPAANRVPESGHFAVSDG
jgi:hypothetical protein